MIRTILFATLFLLVYYSLKTVFRSALKTYRDEGKRPRLRGEEMVLDPQCRTYVVKDRAVARRISGTLTYFCSEGCAQRYEERNRK